MDCKPEAIRGLGCFLVKHGVTSYLATTISADPDVIIGAIENLINCPQPQNGAQHLGAHIEGPYLTNEYKGAHPQHKLRSADPKEYNFWLTSGCVRLITIAPEVDGTLLLMEKGIEKGVEFAIGHSGADYETVKKAADYGLRQATHVFNGMKGIHHREPGTVGAVLSDDRIYAQVIADGIHIHPAIIKIIVRCKGIHRTILITDATRATGLKDGEYEAGGLKYIVTQNIARTFEGGLAGSTLTMDAAIRNMALFTGLPFPDIIPMATSVPAEAIGVQGSKGAIKPNYDADISIFDKDLRVVYTLVSGQIVYQSDYYPNVRVIA